ncbi:MAG: exo-alpha-sialidase [Planctomycetota bacterium]
MAFVFAALSCAVVAPAQLRLAPVFGDHMVLQRDAPLRVWGEAPAGSEVEVTFGEQRVAARSDERGRFEVELRPEGASSIGRELVVSAGDVETRLRDVLCGDVYLCAGQSNMWWPVARSAEVDEVLAAADLPNLRLFNLQPRRDTDDSAWPLAELQALTAANYLVTDGWQASTPTTAAAFSAVAHAFGRRMHLALDVPVGLVQAAVGGSPMESWLAPAAQQRDAELARMLREWSSDAQFPAWPRERAERNLAEWHAAPVGARPHHPFEPSFLYLAGVAPFARMGLAGVVWYQGESNAFAEPARSERLFRGVIDDLRRSFDRPDLPFWFVQLPGIGRDWERFREVQDRVARSTPGVAMAVTLDLGHATDVHPRRKVPVGERLARLALAAASGGDVAAAGGPRFVGQLPEGRRVRVRFAPANGLRSVDGADVRGFELAGEDRVFHAAAAVVDGDEVVLGCRAVERPIAVRYAWADDPDANLVDADLLPAAPFRTDDWSADDVTQVAIDAVGFEELPAGPLRRAALPFGELRAEEGHAEVSERFAANGTHCLHLFGGEDRAVTVALAERAAKVLTFRAERWTRSAPFAFAVEARAEGGEWRELWRGDRTLRVGARFLSAVQVDVPADAASLRLRCTAPADTGVLIDDLRLAPPEPMALVDAGHIDWTAPALHGLPDNPATVVALPVNGTAGTLSVTGCTVELPETIVLADVARVQVRCGPGDDFAAASPFGVPQAAARSLRFVGDVPLRSGANRLWIALELAPDAPAEHRVAARCVEITLGDGTRIAPAGRPRAQRIGVVVRRAGEGGCHTTRIPGLVTTNTGTLLAVYDNRYRSAGDLPGDIDVGVSRSTDGGRTWQPMQIAIDMGDDQAFGFDGVGDPAMLVDRETGTVWIAATWSHGNRSWNGSGPGLSPDETGQLVLVRSDDEGVTWSKPVNITRQVKDPAWRFLLQGPGRGITTRDGTLVFAAQYRSADESPHAGRPFSTILSSRDHGDTWQLGTGVKVDTTEAQVVELGDGSLMLNCRDNRGGARSVYTTRDLGRTWQPHATTRAALPEPVCMASLLRVERDGAGPLLLFSNPATRSGRRDLTLKISDDDGASWPASRHELYDQRASYGYSCLTRIDDRHVGVLYEGTGALYFLRLSLDELLGR